ncbi:murein transglycosylase A [Piscinibacter defluvii]|uniref:murein transglycosylase A n=1 Tax=Piscinibacter defluvii TaxID=1796922 RepID=UPI001F0B7222|nr:MltA domain-containing protein [Piscinibacter defluvii]
MIEVSWRALVTGAAILGSLAGCGSLVDDGPPPAPAPSASAPAGPAIVRARSRWVPVDWAELPGWQQDATRELWPALQRGCDRPAPGWQGMCTAARGFVPASDAQAREWLQARLQPYRVESPEGAADGLITGYFEPLVEAQRLPRAGFRVPLHAPPDDLGARKPWWTRQQIDSLPAAQAALRGRELAWVADPLDALLLQVQGSGRLLLAEPNGTRRLVRLAYAGHNDQPYKSVGRWLIEQGELKPEQASWPGIRAWARANPKRVNELLWSNPRYVFFREEPLPDPALGPRGAQAVPLTPGRSIAVDPQSIPYGTPVWLDATEPLSSTPLRRLVMAQDTGSAITGAVRADYFWGWGEEAEAQAGRMKQPLRLWVLWPKWPSG